MPYKDIEKQREAQKLCMRKIRAKRETISSSYQPLTLLRQKHVCDIVANHMNKSTEYLGDYEVNDISLDNFLSQCLERAKKPSLRYHLEIFNIPVCISLEPNVDTPDNMVIYNTYQLKYYFILTDLLKKQLKHLVTNCELGKLYWVNTEEKVYSSKKLPNENTGNTVSLKKYLKLLSIPIFSSKHSMLENHKEEHTIYTIKKQHIWFQLPPESVVFTNIYYYVQKDIVEKIQRYDYANKKYVHINSKSIIVDIPNNIIEEKVDDGLVAYIYLIREREFVLTDQKIFKVGRTLQKRDNCIPRLRAYKKQSEIICIEKCPAKLVCSCEKQIIEIFGSKFTKHSDGNEYFVGDEESMREVIHEVVKKYRNMSS